MNVTLNEDIVQMVSSFTRGYIFYASVCSTWHRVWTRNLQTKVDDVVEIFQSASRVEECRRILCCKYFKTLQCLATSPHPDVSGMGNALMTIVDDRPDYVNLCQAAKCQNVGFVVWAHAFTPSREWDTAICVLAHEGLLRPLQMLLSLGYKPPLRASISATYGKHRKVLLLLRRYGGSMKYVTQAFADNQDHEGLAWAVKNGMHANGYVKLLLR